MADPVTAEYALVSPLLKAEVWAKLRPATESYSFRVPGTAASYLVSVAEDRRFELLSGCPQHAFQVCARAFAVGQHRLRPWCVA
jgi:hypothetical protein